MSFRVVIPARYASTRLPGKPLARAGGRALVEHVHARAVASGAERVVIATDDARIAEVAGGFGAQVVMTRVDHVSGTDRLAEAVATLAWPPSTVVVNVQGDEPRMPAAVIRQVGEALAQDAGAEMASACAPITSRAEFLDPNVVKVVRDARARALYFSRAPIPWPRDADCDAPPPPEARRHIGIYAYRAGFLARFAVLPAVAIEDIEKLEQLRALHHDAAIVVVDACAAVGSGIDTPADLAALRQELGD